MIDPVEEVARKIKEAGDRGATLRIGVVDAVGPKGVQLDITGTYWAAVDADVVDLLPGDRVYALQQGSVVLVSGRLTPEPSAVPVGSVTHFAGPAAPDGWLFCAGQTVSRTTYAKLFAVIGTTFGAGDGSTTFLLPNLTDRFVYGTGGHARGYRAGEEDVTLLTAHMPAHTHGGAGDHTHSVPGAAGDVTVQSGTGATVGNATSGTTGGGGTHTHATAGSGEAHNNMPPYIVLPSIIRVK